MLNIEPDMPAKPFALFNLGFRPFFLAAGSFATVAMLIWLGIYIFGWQLQPFGSAQIWHAHEMVFGYTLAVIAGFLLTAVKNWTSIQTPHGWSLAVLLLVWLAARVLPFFSGIDLKVVMLVDNLFILALAINVASPIFRTRQWQHSGILLVLVFMLAANLLYYLGLLGHVGQGVSWGLYSGLYLILALIFLMGRRVIPFFIEKGVDENITLNNPRWLDLILPPLFILFWLSDVFFAVDIATSLLASSLFVLHSLRLRNWHTPGIWKKSLLWSIYLAYVSLTFGFLLKAAVPYFGVSSFLALHAFAVGGIGLMTLGMMSRVALGHTGRNVFEPPAILSVIFAIFVMAILVRVFLPLIVPREYTLWIGVSQVFWIAAFMAFTIVYVPILVKPRIDGRSG